MGGFVALAENGDLMGVALLRDVVIARPSVRVNHRPRGDRFFDEGVQIVTRHVGRPSESNAAGSDHRTAQLMEPTPSGLVAAQTEHRLQTQRAPSRFLAGHVPHRLKPHPQGLLRPLKDRPRSHGGSVPTRCTLQVASVRHPGLAAGTFRTTEAFPPPNALQIGQASGLRREPIVEFLQGSGIVNAANRMWPGFASHAGILHLVVGPSKWIPTSGDFHSPISIFTYL